MEMHQGHRDRLRARFLAGGLQGFDPHTVLELLLFYARPRCDTNELAHRLMARFGSFDAVLDAPIEELVQVEGIGQRSALLIKMIPELGAYYLNSRNGPATVLDSTEKAGAFFMPRFIGKRSEEVWIAALDDKRKLLRCAQVSDDGIVNAVRITVKRVVTEAVNSNATGVLMAHNHPGGVALPSASDKQMTWQVYQALRLINIQLLDHIIVAGDDFVSMADSGMLELMEQSRP